MSASSLVSTRPMPRIHVLSDVHLESGPYELPEGLDCDVIVAAGDIGPLELAVPWLAKLGKPVVYVLGNHEYWGRKLDSAVAQAKALAQGTRVHVLEQESVVLCGVRFLGTTLWTSFGDWTPELVNEAWRKMMDFREVELGDWLSSAHKKSCFAQLCRAAGLARRGESVKMPTHLHPAVNFMLHQRAVAWLDRTLSADASMPTVVVTHHAPALACLAGKNVDADLLDSRNWSRYSRHDKLIYVAAYASDLSGLLRRRHDNIDLWVHGHIHTGQDLLTQGVRVLSNPRGRYLAPLTEDSARGYALLGWRVKPEDIERSQALARENPYRGEAGGFDPMLTVRLEDGFERPLRRALAPLRERMSESVDEAAVFEPYVFKGRQTQRLASQRCFRAALERFDAALREMQSQVLPHLDRFSSNHVLQSLDDAPGQPYLPWRDEEVTQASFTECLGDMRKWLDYLEVLPGCAGRRLEAWAAQACRALQYLQAKGLSAAVRRPAREAYRRLDTRELKLVLDAEVAEEQEQQLNEELDRLINGRPPRDWFVQVSADKTDWHGRPLRNLLRLKQLAPFDAQLSLTAPEVPAASTSEW